MSIGRLQVVFYSVLGACILTIITSFSLFDFIEVDTATNWTMRYFALPILIVMTPTCYYIYLRFLRHYEIKEYESEFWTKARNIFRIFTLTIGMSLILVVTTLSIIILTNAYVGDSKTITLDATIVDYYSRKSKGRTRHYIKIEDKQLKRIVELKVDKPYQAGEAFSRTIKIGYWGLLYSN